MTGQGDVASCAKAVRGGAIDFLEKPFDPGTLIEVVERALSVDSLARSAREDQRQLARPVSIAVARSGDFRSSPIGGKLNKQIAEAMGVTERTVKAQRANLMLKLGAATAAHLGGLAERLKTVGATDGEPARAGGSRMNPASGLPMVSSLDRPLPDPS